MSFLKSADEVRGGREETAGREEGAPAGDMETSSFPEAVEQQDDTETGVDWTAAGLDTRDEEAPLSPSAISPSSRVADDTGVDKADDTGTGDVETGSTDGIGVDTGVTGETEAGAVTEGTDETGAVDEVEAEDDTEGSTDMETGVLEDDAGTGTLELEEPQACVQFRAT